MIALRGHAFNPDPGPTKAISKRKRNYTERFEYAFGHRRRIIAVELRAFDNPVPQHEA